MSFGEATRLDVKTSDSRCCGDESPDRITIHGPRLNSNAHLLEFLDVGVWLAEKVSDARSQKQTIEMLLHPVGSPWIRLLGLLFDPAKFLGLDRRSGSSVTGKNRQGVAIIEQVRAQTSTVSIRVNERLTLSIKRIRVGYAKAAFWTICAAWKALQHMHSCLRRQRLNIEEFLLSSYREIQIGDLVASETIATHPTAGGSVRRCSTFALLGGVINAIYTVDYIMKRSWHGDGEHYVTISEKTYLEAIYLRAARQLGLPFLELYDYSGRLRIVAPQDELQNPSVARPHSGRPLSKQQREAVQNYLAERLADAGRHLWYMNVGRNANRGERVVDDNGNVVGKDTDKLTIVMCLHSFDDALYWYGADGFGDLYEWTVVSIDECLQNPHVGRVLIKEHPNVDPITFLGDKHALQRLKARYFRRPKIVWIDRHTNVKTLSSLGYVYGITNHGNIAEELVAAGIPVIASAKGPWGEHYPFPRLWHTPDEYVAMLRGLTVAGWFTPNESEKEALVQYVNEYRLGVFPDQNPPVYLQWMVWRDSNLDTLARDINQQVEQKIAGLDADSPQLIEWLHDRARTHQMDHRCEERDCPSPIAC